jgi:hypothetical protein
VITQSSSSELQAVEYSGQAEYSWDFSFFSSFQSAETQGFYFDPGMPPSSQVPFPEDQHENVMTNFVSPIKHYHLY